jgi:cobalamin biosynthesis protein CobD/CbiB
MKIARFAGALVLALSLVGCGYDGGYRYPCQDPDNWDTKECKPPVCSVAGTCPVDLVGEDIFNQGEGAVNE